VKANRFGLSRDIPSSIKRAVRQACGYGCVVCGSAIVEYEHVDPPFADARTHDAERITLLCPTCHGMVTRGFMSKQTVTDHLAAPACLARGYSNALFDLRRETAEIIIGSNVIRAPSPIAVKGKPLLTFHPAESAGAPIQLTGNFYNSRGELSVMIRENEWQALSTNWDAEAKGGVIVIRDDVAHISLQLRAVPPKVLVVERLDMLFNRCRIRTDGDALRIDSPVNENIRFVRTTAEGPHIGLDICY
jgi:hypothetical protein